MNEYKKDRPTSEQLVDLLDNELEITICADVVHGLDYEYKQLQEENKKQKERIGYLERSNNRREDIILEQRQKISNLEDSWDRLKNI